MVLEGFLNVQCDYDCYIFVFFIYGVENGGVGGFGEQQFGVFVNWVQCIEYMVSVEGEVYCLFGVVLGDVECVLSVVIVVFCSEVQSVFGYQKFDVVVGVFVGQYGYMVDCFFEGGGGQCYLKFDVFGNDLFVVGKIIVEQFEVYFYVVGGYGEYVVVVGELCFVVFEYVNQFVYVVGGNNQVFVVVVCWKVVDSYLVIVGCYYVGVFVVVFKFNVVKYCLKCFVVCCVVYVGKGVGQFVVVQVYIGLCGEREWWVCFDVIGLEFEI